MAHKDNLTQECLAIEVNQGIDGGKMAGISGQIVPERGRTKEIQLSEVGLIRDDF
jgi:hypothetical protein